MAPRIYTTKEVMTLLKISRQTIYSLIKAGVLKPRKRRGWLRAGRGWNFYTEEDLKAAVDYFYPPVDQILEGLGRRPWKYLTGKEADE